jgi:hypothetical protein
MPTARDQHEQHTHQDHVVPFHWFTPQYLWKTTNDIANRYTIGLKPAPWHLQRIQRQPCR